MNRKVFAVLAAVAVTLSASASYANRYDRANGTNDHPLRIVGYVAHAAGLGVEFAVFRPIHWVVSRPELDIVFGHQPKIYQREQFFEWTHGDYSPSIAVEYERIRPQMERERELRRQARELERQERERQDQIERERRERERAEEERAEQLERERRDRERELERQRREREKAEEERQEQMEKEQREREEAAREAQEEAEEAEEEIRD